MFTRIIESLKCEDDAPVTDVVTDTTVTDVATDIPAADEPVTTLADPGEVTNTYRVYVKYVELWQLVYEGYNKEEADRVLKEYQEADATEVKLCLPGEPAPGAVNEAFIAEPELTKEFFGC